MMDCPSSEMMFWAGFAAMFLVLCGVFFVMLGFMAYCDYRYPAYPKADKE